ncbi:hypothetical protein [Catenuloplanes japonicus]|uniref:hypothetical protein n=1 Tax=Catenuloplanes japonicus TaxID=33876 RepID=UPI0012F856CD|nr:hypothetical protein [Catenuloplanes japonicus]
MIHIRMWSASRTLAARLVVIFRARLARLIETNVKIEANFKIKNWEDHFPASGVVRPACSRGQTSGRAKTSLALRFARRERPARSPRRAAWRRSLLRSLLFQATGKSSERNNDLPDDVGTPAGIHRCLPGRY